MQRSNHKKIILLTFGILTPLTFTTFKVNAGSFGAEIFCTMRDGGNDIKVVGKQHTHILKNKREEFLKSHPNKQHHKLLKPLLESVKNLVIALNTYIVFIQIESLKEN